MDRFSGQKLITLQLAGDETAQGLEQFGSIVSVELPKVKLRIPRAEVPRALAAILAQRTIEDVVVEDPPLEEVIASMFSEVSE